MEWLGLITPPSFLHGLLMAASHQGQYMMRLYQVQVLVCLFFPMWTCAFYFIYDN